MTLGAARYWDGSGWTCFVFFGGREFSSPTPMVEVNAASDAADARIIGSYLADAADRGIIGEEAASSLRRDLEELVGRVERGVQPAAGGAPAPPSPRVDVHRTVPLSPPSSHAPAAAPTQAELPTPSPEPRPTAAPVHTEPGLLERWWRQAREAVVSDLAVHGLAYLGVLLLFVGVFGLLYYSAEMEPGWRFIADVAAPTAFFASGWYLHRRGATTVAAALTLLGGMVLPIVAVASLTDGSNVPPDAHGTALPIIQAVLCAAISIALALVVRRNPASVLRFVVAPTMWLAAGLLAGLARDPIPTGQAVARATAVQMAAILAAIAVTSVVLRLRGAGGTLAGATTALTLPAAGTVYLLELVLAANQQWPVVSGVIAALSAIVIIECSSHRLPAVAVPIAEVVVVATGTLRLFQEFDVAWVAVGALVVLLAVTELTGRLRPTGIGTVVCLVGAGFALAATAHDPTAGLTAFTIATAWLLLHRSVRSDWLPINDPYGVAPAIGLAGVAAESWRLLDPGWAVVAFAVSAMAMSAARRMVPVLRADPLWKWWPPTMAVVTITATLSIPWPESRGQVIAASAVCAAAIAISVIPVAARTWLTGAAVLWSLANVAALLEVTDTTQVVVLASLALAGVAGALAVDAAVPRQLGWMGHLLGLCALAVPMARGWTPAIVVGLAATGWLATAVVHELRGAHHIVHFRTSMESTTGQSWSAVDTMPSVAAIVGVCVTSVLMLDAATIVAFDSAWASTSISVLAVAVAVITRLTPWRRANRTVLTYVAFAMSLAAGLTATGSVALHPWPVIVALAAGLVVVIVTPRPVPPLLRWTGWAETAPLTLLLAEQAGLDRRWSDVALCAWGAVLVIGTCAVDRVRHGRAAWNEGFRSPALYAPGSLGILAFLLGGWSGTVDESDSVIGWLSLAIAAVVLAVALLRPLAAISALTHVLATVSLCLVVPWHPFEHPWSLVLWAAVLLVIAWAVRAPVGASLPTRWDLPAFGIGHGVIVAALLSSTVHGSVAATFGAASLVAFAVAFLVPLPAWAVMGAAMALVSAADVGLGWLAVALAVEGVAITAFGLTRSDRWRLPMLVAGALQLSSAWVAFIVWRAWTPETVLVVTAPLAAALTLAATISIRAHRLPLDLMAVWAITGTVGSLLASTLALRPDEVDRLTGGCTVAASMAMLAVAAGITAEVFGAGMRWVASVACAASLTMVAYALEPGATPMTLLASGLAFGVCVALLLVHAVRPASPWIRPPTLIAAYSQLCGVVALSSVTSHRSGLLMIVLIVIAGEVAAAASFLQHDELFMASPLLACGAWMVFASDALEGESMWLTVPAGVTLLIEVGILRWILRGRQGDATSVGVAMLEYVGMSFVVGGFLIRTLQGQLGYSLLAIVAGMALLGWGAATRVRRRAGFGFATVVLAAVLLIGVPLSAAIPTWHGPALWLAVAALGALAIVVATLVEQGRRTARHFVEAFDDITSGWERTGGPDVWLVDHPDRGTELADDDRRHHATTAHGKHRG